MVGLKKGFVLALLVLLAACATAAQGERYRGDYTFGHEVNTFCPEIYSQCYWLGPRSRQDARTRLKRIYQEKKPGLYKPVCVVVDGVIDRDSPRSGFAADYDGLIDIESVHGTCADDPGDELAVAPGATLCEEPRPEACTRDYRPVCGTHGDGSPGTYSNGCVACANAEVVAWVEGACPE